MHFILINKSCISQIFRDYNSVILEIDMDEMYSVTAKLIASEVSSIEEVNFDKLNKNSICKKVSLEIQYEK